MWQPNNNAPPPPLPMNAIMSGGMAMMNNGVDWGVAAQQWLRNKEMYEQWQQQQYQMMMAAQAAAHAATMANCIDPTVVTNPPPPPPDSSTTQVDVKHDDSTSNIPPLMGSGANTPNKSKLSQFKSRFSNSPQFNNNNNNNSNNQQQQQQQQQQDQPNSKGKPLFAAYDSSNDQPEKVT